MLVNALEYLSTLRYGFSGCKGTTFTVTIPELRLGGENV